MCNFDLAISHYEIDNGKPLHCSIDNTNLLYMYIYCVHCIIVILMQHKLTLFGTNEATPSMCEMDDTTFSHYCTNKNGLFHVMHAVNFQYVRTCCP